jgi:ElaB/YqjD/DUF883 family membrane-anchored ribosome-binding protein
MENVRDIPGGNSDIHKLKAELKQLRDDISELSGTLKEIVADKAKQGQAKAQEAVDMTGKKIGEHPFMSMLIALGAGFLVGLLMQRNRSS